MHALRSHQYSSDVMPTATPRTMVAQLFSSTSAPNTSFFLLTPRHHHFTGGGLHDAQLDFLLHQSLTTHPEILSHLVCKLEHTLADSAHDLILSTCFLPSQFNTPKDISENIVVTRVENNRIKMGQGQYSRITGYHW